MSGKSGGVKETPQQRAQAQVAVQQLADFRQRWMPVQRQLADTIVKAGGRESTERKQAQGMASTDTAARFGDAGQKLREATEAQGLGGSARQKLAVAGLGDDAATSSGFGVAGADAAIDNAYVQGLGQIMQLGRGEKATAMAGMGQVARMSGATAANDASLALQRRAGNAQVAGQVLGMGLSQFGGATPGMDPSSGSGSEVYALGAQPDGFTTNPQAGF